MHMIVLKMLPNSKENSKLDVCHELSQIGAISQGKDIADEVNIEPAVLARELLTLSWKPQLSFSYTRVHM